MNKYEKTLKLFTGYDQYREWTQEPHGQGDYVYASDTHIAIQIEKRLLEYDYTELERPNFAHVFDVKQNHDVKMSLKEMMETYDNIPYTTTELCGACSGRGTVDFEFEYDSDVYTQEGECPVCGGEGYVESGVKKRDFRFYVSFPPLDGAVKQKHFRILIEAMQALEVDSIRLIGSNSAAFLFEVCEGVRIVVSSFVKDRNRKYVVKYKEKQKDE